MEILRQKGVWLKYTLKKMSFVNNLDIGFLKIYTSYYEKKNIILFKRMHFFSSMDTKYGEQIATNNFFYYL